MENAKENAKTKNLTLPFQQRDNFGRGATRSLRRQGLIPGVISSSNHPTQHIAIDYRHIERVIKLGALRSNLLHLVDADNKRLQALTKDVHFHPVKDSVIHIDFHRVAATTRIRIEVPVQTINNDICPGLKMGGILSLVRHSIEVFCQAGAIPDAIIVDLANSNIGDSIHISQVDLPAGVKLVIDDRDFTIATISGMMSERTEVEEVDAATEEAEAATEDDEDKEDKDK